jgi:hypothetical protein
MRLLAEFFPEFDQKFDEIDELYKVSIYLFRPIH